MHRNKFLYIFLAVTIILTIFIRIRWLNIPLERDEGEYAYAGQLILQGIPPYSLAYNMKLPGIYYMYAAILAVFGQSIQAIHLGLLIVTLTSIFIFFLLCKKLFNPAIAAIACAVYAILGLTSSIYGFSANAEPFVLLFILPAILIEIYALKNHRTWQIFASGLFFGMAFLMKQHAAAFILFGGLWLLVELLRQKPFSLKKFLLFPTIFSIGLFLPYIITCCLMWKFGVFDQFWFWTVDYARQYVSQIALKTAVIRFFLTTAPIIIMTLPILIIAMIGLIVSITVKTIKKKKYFAAVFFVFSFLAVCPGFLFREHYFIFMMPSIGLLCALGLYYIYILLLKIKIRFLPQALFALILTFAIVYPITIQRNYMFTMTSDQISKYCYGSNPFVESVEIAKYIKEHSNEDDLITVFGSEPQIYFYSNRKSATGYIYTYPLVEKQDYAKIMQKQMIYQVEKNNPKYIIAVNISLSWLIKTEQGKNFLYWASDYAMKNYDLEGVIDFVDDKPNYIWGQEAKQYILKSSSSILILKRKIN